MPASPLLEQLSALALLPPCQCSSSLQATWLLLVGPGAGSLVQPASILSPLTQEFKGYVFKIMGGQDKQGFPMKQGVLVPGRVQLLMKPGDSCFRGFGRRKGERRRKSVRGCIVSQDLSVLNLMIVKAGRSLQRRHAVPPAHYICHCWQASSLAAATAVP